MKAVLISIQPKWVEKIASGEKTIEIRKTKPKLETPFKCYIYCTIGNGVKGDYLVPSGIQCGKVIGEFVCDRIDEFHEWELSPSKRFYKQEKARLDLFLKESCLSYGEVCEYRKNLQHIKPLYAWHISNIKIYDKPKWLSEFRKPCKFAYSSYEEGICYEDCIKGKLEDCRNFCLPITRPPQSWCYVEELGDKK